METPILAEAGNTFSVFWAEGLIFRVSHASRGVHIAALLRYLECFIIGFTKEHGINEELDPT